MLSKVLSFLWFLNNEAFKLALYITSFGMICYQTPILFGSPMLFETRKVLDVSLAIKTLRLNVFFADLFTLVRQRHVAKVGQRSIMEVK